jgi:hypothetical protein
MYLVRKKRNEQCFCVKHAQTGDIHSEHATRKAALAQLRQLSVGGMRRHILFGNTGLPTQQVPIPPRPPTPEFVPAPAMSQTQRDQALDALAPSLSGLLYPAARAPARAPRPAPYASASSASSASSFQPLNRPPAVILLKSDVKGFLDDFKASRAIPEPLKAMYKALTVLGVSSDAKRILYASAMYNLGYKSSRDIYQVNTNHHMRDLLTYIDSNLKTIIPGSRGGVKGKNLKKGTLFGMPITDSGDRIPAPKKRMTLKEFHALEGVPGMHPLYNVFPQGKRAKEAIRGTEDAHEDALFKRDMAKLKKKANKWSGAPKATKLAPIAQAYHALRQNPRDYASLDEFDRVGAVIP